MRLTDLECRGALNEIHATLNINLLLSNISIIGSTVLVQIAFYLSWNKSKDHTRQIVRPELNTLVSG